MNTETETLETLSALSDEELNVRLAELLGWNIQISEGGVILADGRRAGGLRDHKGEAWGFLWIKPGDTLKDHTYNLPRFCSDLNETAKVEADLDSCKRAYFQCKLVEITSEGAFDMKAQPIASMHYVDALNAIHATPRQRTVALILTLQTAK